MPKFPIATVSTLTLSVGSAVVVLRAPFPSPWLCSRISSSLLSSIRSAASHQILLLLASHPPMLLLFSLWHVPLSLCFQLDLCWVVPSGETAGVGMLTVIFSRVLLTEGGRCVGIAVLEGRHLMLFWKLKGESQFRMRCFVWVQRTSRHVWVQTGS